MLRRSAATFATLAALAGCAPPQEPPATPAAPPSSSTSSAPAAPATPPAAEAPSSSGYAGHGAESIKPEVLAKYAAPALPPALSRSIGTLFEVRAPGAGILSPDAKALYFTWTITGIRQLFRIDGAMRFPSQLTGGEDATVIVDMTPDGRTLVISRDRKGEEYPGLYLQDAKGGPLVEIQHKARVQTMHELITDDGKYLYFRANDIKPTSYAIYRYDIAAKKRELVFDQEGIWRLTDIGKDGRMLLGRDVGGNMTEFFEYDPATKKLTPVIGQGEREEHEAIFGVAPGEILVLTPKLGEYRRLYSLKGGKLTPVTPELKYDVESFEVDRARKRLYYQINEEGYSRLKVIDARTYKDIALPALPRADHVRFSSATPDGRYATLWLDPGNGPSVSYVLDWQAKKLTQWHAPSIPELDASKFAVATLESYPARDGTKIPMLVRRPANCEKPGGAAAATASAGEPCPVIVMFHGGPEGQARPGFSPRVQLLVDAGFIVAEPNVRGSDGYGRTWLHADDGAKRLDILTDIEDASKYIRANWGKNGRVPKVGIFGGSYGGYSTLVGMTMFAGAYDAGVSVVGISNLLTFLQNTAPYRRILRTSEYGDPDKDREVLLKLSPITYLDRVKAPLLIIQGATDPRVPAGESIQMHEALEAKKIPSELILFADEGHGAQKRDNQVLQYGHVVRFFRQHLRGERVD
ncbi:S9 family peptidase [Chondromyces crocatus]|nr:prolyl oligopeptidase family serine peptidase [Chondromyces crocatus]